MEYVRFGKSNILVSQAALSFSAFQGSEENFLEGVSKAYEAGINFFSLSYDHRGRTVKNLFRAVRRNSYVCVFSKARSAEELLKDTAFFISAYNLFSIDFFFVNASSVGKITDALFKLKNTGRVKHLGLKTDTLNFLNGLSLCEVLSPFDAIAFPFTPKSDALSIPFINECAKIDVGILSLSPFEDVANLPFTFGFYKIFKFPVPLFSPSSPASLASFLKGSSLPPRLDKDFLQELKNTNEAFNFL